MKIRVLIFIMIFIILSFVSSILLQYNKNSGIDHHLEQITEQYTQSYNSIYKGYKKLADIIYKTNINTREVKEIFALASTATQQTKESVRIKLYNHLKAKYKFLQQYNIRQLHFHLPNNESFLRFHRANKFGDNLSNIRETVKYVNKNKKSIDGFEEGKVYNGYRFVFPLFFENNHIGSVEVSFSTLAMSLEVMNEFKVIAPFLISKKAVDKKVFSDEQKNYILSPCEEFYFEKKAIKIVKEFSKVKCEHTISQKSKEIVIKRGFDNDSFSIYDELGKDIMTFIKVLNPVSKKVVGILLIRSDATFIFTQINNFYLLFFISIILIALLLLLIYKGLEEKIKVISEAKEEQKRNIELEKLNKEVKKSKQEIQKINENLAITIDKEIEKNKIAQEQLFEAEKMASMGEMIGNIAHQWRQPLSVISTNATGMQMQKEYGILSDEKFNQACNSINDNAQYLSKTIDDFRDYIKGDRIEEEFYIKNIIDKFLNIVEPTKKNNDINIILDIQEDIKFKGYPNELIQCFINIFNNAKDVLVDLNIKNRLLFIIIKKSEHQLSIKFKDNGKGIASDILDKIFEPYFTTKHKSKGTGLGLHMTYEMIVNGMKGNLEVKNTQFKYNNTDYTGAEFTIILPLI